MKLLSVLSFTAIIGAFAMPLVSTAASAAIVCNQDGECWHTQTNYQYQPTFGLTVHQNDWRWKDGEKHAWREHDGRGYWRGGSWQTF